MNISTFSPTIMCLVVDDTGAEGRPRRLMQRKWLFGERTAANGYDNGSAGGGRKKGGTAKYYQYM